jgi:hypothetical protein
MQVVAVVADGAVHVLVAVVVVLGVLVVAVAVVEIMPLAQQVLRH